MSKYAHLAEPDPQLVEILSSMLPFWPRSKDIHVVRQGFIDHLIDPKMERLEPSFPPGAYISHFLSSLYWALTRIVLVFDRNLCPVIMTLDGVYWFRI